MTKLLLALAAGSAAVLATPAMADRVVPGHQVSVDARIANLETRFIEGVADGRFTRSEAQQLRQRIVALDATATRYKADGFTPQEQSDLRQQINLTRTELQRADGSRSYAMWRDRAGRAS